MDKKKPSVSRQSVPKTNYLKTNLLKQIKKISFTFMVSLLFCKRRHFSFTLQRYDVFETFAKELSKI